MAGLDDLLQANSQNLAGTDLTFTDADTLKGTDGTDEVEYRLQGIDTREAYHPGIEGSEYEAGAAEQTARISKIASDNGFNRVVKTGETDPFGREVIDLQDSAGRSLSQIMASRGLADVHTQFDPNDELGQAQDYGEFLRSGKNYEGNEYDEAASAIKTAIEAEQKYADGVNANFTISDYDRSDLDKEGNALNPLSTAWDTAMLGVSEAAYGMANMMGEKLGIEGLETYGEAGVLGKRAQIGDQGKILTDYKDVDGFGTAVEYLANNTLMSLPYMAITMAGAALSPFTGGLSLTAPAAIYTGQAWNEMGDHIKENGKERSASIAIATGVAQATLDRLGLAAIFRKGVQPRQLLKDAEAALIKQGYKPEDAAAKVANASKREIAGYLGDVGKVAKQQVEAKKLGMNTLKRMGVGAGGEAVTEGMQEAIAGIGADIGSGSEIDWMDIQDRAIQGMIAGGAIGGAFTVPGAANDAVQWANIAWGVDREDPNAVTQSTRFAREEEQAKGYVPTIQELTAETRAAPEALEQLSDRADRHRAKRKTESVKETLSSAMVAIPSLWRGATRHIFTPELQRQSRAARVLADMFGGNLQRVFGGSNFENAKHHKVAVYKNMVDIPHNVYLALNNGRDPSRKDKLRISTDFYNTVQAAVDKDGNFDPNLIPDGPHKQQIVRLANQLNDMGDKMYRDQEPYNPELGYVKNYLHKYKAINSGAVNANRSEFIDALKSEYNMSEADATNIADNIIDGTTTDIDEAFSIVKGGPRPASHKRRSLGLSENAKFQKFVEPDLFTNVSQAAKSAARYTALQEFVGDNANHISKLLEQMQKDGVPPEVVDRVAAQVQDYLDAESGNYKRPTSEFGKSLQKIQKNFMLFTTMAGLPLATISSFVEAALTMRGLTREQIFKKNGGLSHLGKEFAEMISSGMGEIAVAEGAGPRRGRKITPATKGKNQIRNLGYNEWDVGAATTTGVTETHAWHTGIMEKYFKWIGLQGWTNYTRAVRAAIAGDYIVDQIDVLLSQDPNAPRTNEAREAEEKLRNLGIDVSRGMPTLKAVLTGQATPEQEAAMADQIREASFNFVNEAVALPQSGNRPLIYQDPRFALFTQFQGFMSTFTANHIPRLWGEYIKRGSPTMRYNTFAMMTTMIMLGFASQYLKDLLKYGGDNPYLDEAELVQRGIRASGLLGTGERVLDQFFPLYETRSKDAGEWLFNTATGESPALSQAKRIAGAAGAAIQGQGERAVYQGLKSAPITGPFTGLNKAVADWAFDGE